MQEAGRVVVFSEAGKLHADHGPKGIVAMADMADLDRARAELEKLRLEIAKLTLDVGNASRFAPWEMPCAVAADDHDPGDRPRFPLHGVAVSIGTGARRRYASQQQAIDDARERTERARKETETAEREFMKPLLEKQQELDFEAAAAAATIASTNDVAERRRAEGRFWVLFWGPLVMVESTEVSGAMKRFGACLSQPDACSHQEIKDRSLALASTLETSLLNTWNARPEDFIKGQFVYR